MKDNIKSEIVLQNQIINIIRIDGKEYISLTDLAKTQNNEAPADVVKNWLRNKETISFLGIWEELNNNNFKLVEFDQFKSEAGNHTFTMSPQKWIKSTNAELIKLGLKQEQRLIRLNQSAKDMMKILEKNKLIDNLKYIEKISN